MGNITGELHDLRVVIMLVSLGGRRRVTEFRQRVTELTDSLVDSFQSATSRALNL